MSIKDEMREEEEEPEITPLTGRAENDELEPAFERENVKDYIGKMLIIKQVNIVPTVKEDSSYNVSLIDGYIVDDEEVIMRAIKEVRENFTLSKETKDEIKKNWREILLYSTSKGVYNSLIRSVIPQLKNGMVITMIDERESGRPQNTIVLVGLREYARRNKIK